MATILGVHFSRACMSSITALALVMSAPKASYAGSKNAIGAAIGIGAGLLILNEAAKAMQNEGKRPQRSRARDDDNDQPREARKTRGAKPKQDDTPEKVEIPEKVKAPETQEAPKAYGFEPKPREYIYALPDKPSDWTGKGGSVLNPGDSMVGRELGLSYRAAAFGGTPATAAGMFVDLMKARASGALAMTESEVRSQAGTAYDGETDLVQLVNRGQASGLALKEERVQALIIGQAWRNIEDQPADASPSATVAPDRITAAFQKAARDILVQSQAAYEAVRLTRSGETLVGSINDVIARGGKQPELVAAASDRGRGLMRALETEVPDLVRVDTNPTSESTASSFEIRRRLLDCVSLRLSSVADGMTAAASGSMPIERAMGEPGRPPEARSWFVSQIISDAKTNCVPLLSPVKPQGPQMVPASNVPARKASAPEPVVPNRAMLAGHVTE